MSNPYAGANIGLQLLSTGATIAGAARRTDSDRLNRRISRGGQDPALTALRSQLASQNARTAMAVAASQQGVNPALAQRNAQMALAESQARTNAQFAQMGAQSALQARQAATEADSRRLGGITTGLATGLNTLGQFMQTTAPQDGAKPEDMYADKAAAIAAYQRGPETKPGPVTLAPAFSQQPPQPQVASSFIDLPAPTPQAQITTQPAGQMQMQGATPSGVGPGLGPNMGQLGPQARPADQMQFQQNRAAGQFMPPPAEAAIVVDPVRQAVQAQNERAIGIQQLAAQMPNVPIEVVETIYDSQMGRIAGR